MLTAFVCIHLFFAGH